MAALRAFGSGIENLDFSLVKSHGHAIMSSSPVDYVRNATLRGSVFGSNGQEGSVCCAFTNFWVDHTEPLEVRKSVEEAGVKWPLGELPEACEFLVIADVVS